MRNVDKTIECLCEKIQELTKENGYEANLELAELTKALASLIGAKANAGLACNN